MSRWLRRTPDLLVRVHRWQLVVGLVAYRLGLAGPPSWLVLAVVRNDPPHPPSGVHR